MREKHINFKSENLRLEGHLSFFGDGKKHPSAVICHPHPLYGGNMENNVIIAFRDALYSIDVVTLRFNFRGTGGSDGRFDNGVGEETDMENAVKFLLQQEEVDKDMLYISGYSFGAAIVLRGASRFPSMKKIAVVAPPIYHYNFSYLKEDKRPKLVIVGEYDNVCPPDDAKDAFSGVPNLKIKFIGGADHFFRGYEGEIGSAVQEFLRPT